MVREPRVETVLSEAFAIADGKTMQLGTTAHVCALVRLIREIHTEHATAMRAILDHDCNAIRLERKVG